MSEPEDDPMLRISLDRTELDVARIHQYLSQESYWARGLSRALLDKALKHSLCFGGYLNDVQVAFARVVTDQATFAHLKDIFVFPPYRGRGYGVAIIRAIMAHPDLGDVGFTLATNDAHALYERFGFTRQVGSERVMVRAASFLPRQES
jgi:ribosomal protein S18 acetylase RimI-like enzyme